MTLISHLTSTNVILFSRSSILSKPDEVNGEGDGGKEGDEKDDEQRESSVPIGDARVAQLALFLLAVRQDPHEEQRGYL